MSKATKKEILKHINYMSVLMSKIEESGKGLDDKYWSPMESGTIKNLSPELSKASSKLKRMLCWGYQE